MNPIPRSILRFVVLHDGKKNQLAYEFSHPTVQGIPLPGDEVQLQTPELKTIGVEKQNFVVKSRRFVIGELPIGITSIVFLVIE